MSRFIAAMDHSGGSTGGVLERYEQEYTEDTKMEKVHAMRLRMVNSPDFNDKNIWGAILYSDTVERGMVPLLKAKGIEPISEPEMARYNAPWSLPFMRRNEVMVRY